MVSQFSDCGDTKNLSDFINIPAIYPAGRLDKDSEGLLLLTDNGKLQHELSHPKFGKTKSYWVQVEGIPDAAALEKFCTGLQLKDGLTRPAKAKIIDEPDIWQRTPAVRFRKHIPTSWLAIQLSEGKNRQIRRMTAHIGYPTLRLIRYAIGPYSLDNTQPGQIRNISSR